MLSENCLALLDRRIKMKDDFDVNSEKVHDEKYGCKCEFENWDVRALKYIERLQNKIKELKEATPQSYMLHLENKILNLEKRCVIMKEALERYGNKTNWVKDKNKHGCEIDVWLQGNCYELAKEALDAREKVNNDKV
jgi:hypothetical protein